MIVSMNKTIQCHVKASVMLLEAWVIFQEFAKEFSHAIAAIKPLDNILKRLTTRYILHQLDGTLKPVNIWFTVGCYVA